MKILKPPIKRHVYNDDGILQHSIVNRKLLDELARALEPINLDSLDAVRIRCLNAACSVRLEYEAHHDLAGIGGCTDTDTWRALRPDDAVEAIIKDLLFDAIDQGYLSEEFLLIVWNAVCKIQLNFILSKNMLYENMKEGRQ